MNLPSSDDSISKEGISWNVSYKLKLSKHNAAGEKERGRQNFTGEEDFQNLLHRRSIMTYNISGANDKQKITTKY